jgi:glutamyl-tRNA reductase
MSVLVVGISHKSAPVALLERLALDGEARAKLLHDLVDSEHIGEAAVLATCNRLEVYTEVDRFHGSVEEVTARITSLAGDAAEDVVPHLYVQYEDAAVSQLFHVAAGLDSLAVGEGQILGQTRAALIAAQETGTAGHTLNALFQQALRVGKRAHAETGIDQVAPSLVEAALAECAAVVGPLEGRRVLVIGAGSMAGLALATLERLGERAEVTLLNRSTDRADALAASYGAAAVPLSSLPDALADADLVIACTGSPGTLIRPEHVTGPMAIIDLALPHDVDPAVGGLPGVTLINLETLAETLKDHQSAREVAEVRGIVRQEVAAYLAARQAASVTPTVVALRSMATQVVQAELARLDQRMPDLDEATRTEVVRALRRVADKLLHRPTVRVRELAGSDPAGSYAAALAELFSLDAEAIDSLTRPSLSEDEQ